MSSQSINVFSLSLRHHLVEQSALNAWALLFLAVLGFLGFTLLSVFEPFIRPLAWAICVGALLNPIKQSLIQTGRQWLENIETTESLLTVQLFFAPLYLILFLMDQLRIKAEQHKRIIAGILAVFLLHLMFDLLGVLSLFSSTCYYFCRFLLTQLYFGLFSYGKYVVSSFY